MENTVHFLQMTLAFISTIVGVVYAFSASKHPSHDDTSTLLMYVVALLWFILAVLLRLEARG